MGGGATEPQRLPRGGATELDSGEKARGVRGAAWDEVRGDPGTGVGVVDRYLRLGQPVPQGGPTDPTHTVNGYIYDAATGAFTEAVG